MNGDESLPYEGLFQQAEREGRVLHRRDIYGSGPPQDIVSEEILQFVMDNVGATVLDVGCGLGPYVARLKAAGKHAIGVDINEEVVALAQGAGRPIELMSAYDLRFVDASFESVIMIETLEHLSSYTQALAEAARVSSLSIVVTVPDISVLPLMSKRQVVPWHILEATHVNFFTPELVRKTLLRFAPSCELTSLGPFFDVDGTILHMHIGGVARF